MRYFVNARLKVEKSGALKQAIDHGTLGQGSIAGGEYLRNMKSARLLEDGTVAWIAICFCNPPLAEERPYWEAYFNLIQISDAIERSTCLHETGEEKWACKICSCSIGAETRLEQRGLSFYQWLTKQVKC